MTKPFSPTTPQFRMALVRRLKSMEPDFEVAFADSRGGISFRMMDEFGRWRSRRISIYVNDGHALDRARLREALRRAGFPGKAMK
jgi:hypothetical protein